MAKGKIFSRDEADKAGKASELSQKIFSGFCEKCLIRPDADSQRHALSGQCIHLLINGLQKRHMNIGRKHFHRMRIKVRTPGCAPFSFARRFTSEKTT